MSFSNPNPSGLRFSSEIFGRNPGNTIQLKEDIKDGMILNIADKASVLCKLNVFKVNAINPEKIDLMKWNIVCSITDYSCPYIWKTGLDNKQEQVYLMSFSGVFVKSFLSLEWLNKANHDKINYQLWAIKKEDLPIGNDYDILVRKLYKICYSFFPVGTEPIDIDFYDDNIKAVDTEEEEKVVDTNQFSGFDNYIIHRGKPCKISPSFIEELENTHEPILDKLNTICGFFWIPKTNHTSV